MASPDITFAPILEFPRGTFFDLASRSYSAIADDVLLDRFRKADEDTFDNPNTIAPCVTVTCLQKEPIGLIAFDPRPFPQAIIGQNCIVPEFQGKGFGRLQLQNLLDKLKARAFTTAVATTADEPFFASSRRMYDACGFEKSTERNKIHQGRIEYSIRL